MTEQRPARLRRPPKPAADEAIDPIAYRPSAAQATTPERTKPSTAVSITAPVRLEQAVVPSAALVAAAERQPNATTSAAPAAAPLSRRATYPTDAFSARLAVHVVDLIAEIPASESRTQRSVVEDAIRQYRNN